MAVHVVCQLSQQREESHARGNASSFRNARRTWPHMHTIKEHTEAMPNLRRTSPEARLLLLMLLLLRLLLVLGS